ncbi:2-amino-4-hydroxy-6-hydroxymethyldihydropteridine diphosphokinase [Photobacterium sp. 2_MG-2023]|uniref:2-amino-4-hydroxy-6-hydroxymethyldihydropteridine pyrophosphokinase n=1 Tax=Photobacterium arenosum TaxID=2774143 RepID=A0ABR9BLF8_9GAMM|nr:MULTISPECIES: 2-amino-4-hydroxy-6-hydroxymethyldihydropteridine diphosphokinase [Photobacterium]MBD8513034.1 2-amino-4-hydroxy-6-hydroxymethyldihydropteridine diphosphokinase [Photobacterium arenosum]MBV7261968.1 2-amino-4-hydroxy-6-hydroxymethyldihydropteridine diphosphokinase [Photobacterium sp. WH24]MDO6582019.1 2-amino-4-hydroxy-6-hydroxymethyldihydropteridine diphosphokinase [Photobacterium sp. 2_MG-2023]
MIRAYIAIGSNLNDPVNQAYQALTALRQACDLSVVAESSLYCSTPMGPQDQPDYINAVVAVDTELTPLALLDLTQKIEQLHGRVRKAERWGPRTLDLDILLYGNLQHHCERLTIPHYGMKAREFVLYPLAEIAPELVLPDGTALTDLLPEVDRNGLRVWSS